MFLLHPYAKGRVHIFDKPLLPTLDMAYLTFSIQVHAETPLPGVPTGELLTISLRILSFSIRSVSFFCSLSVLACQVATALDNFWILPATDRWYSLKSLACCKMLFRYSYRTRREEEKGYLKSTTEASVKPKKMLCEHFTTVGRLESSVRQVPWDVSW